MNLDDFAALKAAAPGIANAAVPEPDGFSMAFMLLAVLAFLRRHFSPRARLATACVLAASATTLQAADLNGRMVRVSGNQINNTREAQDILRGTAAPRTIEEDVRAPVSLIDFGGGVGTFDATQPYLNGVEDTSQDDFLVQVTGFVTIPAGEWSVGLGTDDGGIVKIPGVQFTERYNATGGTPDDELLFNGTRGHGWTMGEFTLDEPVTTQFEALMFERGGGNSFEVAILDALVGSNDPLDFEILGDGVLGWEVVEVVSGDFDMDGSVGFSDFLNLAANFGTGV